MPFCNQLMLPFFLARHEPKGRTKGHGWGAARSSFVTKPKDMANTGK